MTHDPEINANIVDRKQNVKLRYRLHRFKIRLCGGQLGDSNEEENLNCVHP
jgi:hypothetical protein